MKWFFDLFKRKSKAERDLELRIDKLKRTIPGMWWSRDRTFGTVPMGIINEVIHNAPKEFHDLMEKEFGHDLPLVPRNYIHHRLQEWLRKEAELKKRKTDFKTVTMRNEHGKTTIGNHTHQSVKHTPDQEDDDWLRRKMEIDWRSGAWDNWVRPTDRDQDTHCGTQHQVTRSSGGYDTGDSTPSCGGSSSSSSSSSSSDSGSSGGCD
jgi:hypothetical protein